MYETSPSVESQNYASSKRDDSALKASADTGNDMIDQSDREYDFSAREMDHAAQQLPGSDDRFESLEEDLSAAIADVEAPEPSKDRSVAEIRNEPVGYVDNLGAPLPGNYANIPDMSKSGNYANNPFAKEAPASSQTQGKPNYGKDYRKIPDLIARFEAKSAPAREGKPTSAMESGAKPGFLPDWDPKNTPSIGKKPQSAPVSQDEPVSPMERGAKSNLLPGWNPKNSPSGKSPYGTPIPANEGQQPAPRRYMGDLKQVDAMRAIADSIKQSASKGPSLDKGAQRKASPAVPSPEPQEEIVTETRNSRDPLGENERTVSKLPANAVFEGHIIAKKSDGGLIVRNPAKGLRGDGELTHLPPSAAKAIESNPGGWSAIEKSMTYGAQGTPIQISHQNGKWSMKSSADTTQQHKHK